MKFSKKTIEILKNFYSINPSILFREGNKLSTISESATEYAIATLEEYIPKEFAIYDINKLLSVINLMNNPDIEITDHALILTNNKIKTTYMLASKNTIISSPDEDIEIPESIIKFDLKKEDLESCMKALSILSMPELAFIGENGTVTMQTKDCENAIKDNYSIEISETTIDFEAIIKVDHLKILPNNYLVHICEGVVYLESENVNYFIGTQS